MEWVHLDYVWVDGSESPRLRSKTKVVKLGTMEDGTPELPLGEWNFDGSSTSQATTIDSERVLQPMRLYRLSPNHFVALCEVFHPPIAGEYIPHETNYRAELREQISQNMQHIALWIGWEQEYFFTKNGRNILWPDGSGEPPKNDGYYCASGGTIKCRKLVREHADVCNQLGINIVGYNAEVAPGQWEYQCFAEDALKACDDLWMSRFLLEMMCESQELGINWNPKPHEGWNGSGCHTNFSTVMMREAGEQEHFEDILATMKGFHDDTMLHYGAQNRRRLSGTYETAPYDKFSFGIGSRGDSVRIPNTTVSEGWKGYIEDRRPASNCDPYRVALQLTKFVL